MNKATTYILLAIGILLAGYIYLVEFKQKSETEQKKEAARRLFHFVEDSVQSVEIINGNGEFQFQKEDSGWQLITPLKTEADETALHSLFNSLENLKSERRFPISREKLGDFGLHHPAVVLRVTLQNGRKDSLRLGDNTPVGGYVFASKTDTVVFTVEKSIKAALGKSLQDWRDKRLLHFEKPLVSELVVHRGQERIRFVRKEDGSWWIANIERPAEDYKITNILDKLNSQGARNFIDNPSQNLRRYGLQSPAYRVEVFIDENHSKQVLRIGKKVDDGYYARDDARRPVFEVNTALVDELKKPVNDFRDRDLVKFDREGINGVVVAYNDTILTCRKDSGGRWYLDEPEMPPADGDRIETLLDNISYARISDFVGDNPKNLQRYGLDKPALKTQLFKDDSLLVEIRLGKKLGARYYAMTNQFPSVYLVAKSVFDDLKIKRQSLLLTEKKENEEK